jgi:hypothetical protein
MRIEALAFFMDHFGMLVWFFLLWVSITDLRNSKLKKWPRIILLIMGVLGMLIDGGLLILNYSIKGLVKFAPLYDHAGIPVFAFIIWLSLKDFKNKKIKRSRWSKWILFLIGLGGLIVDGFVVFNLWI